MKLPWADIISKRLPARELCPGVVPPTPPPPPKPPKPPPPPSPPTPKPPKPPPPVPPIPPPPPLPPWPPPPGPPHPPSPGPTEKEHWITVYPEASDGWIMNMDSTWNAARGATEGMDCGHSDSYKAAALSAYTDSGDYFIYRCFFRFDLSAIPASAQILRAFFFSTTYQNHDSHVGCQRGTQGPLIDEMNYNSFAEPLFGSCLWHAFDPDNLRENEIMFNAAGLTYLQSRFGYTAKLCLREYDHDYLNNSPTDPEGYIRNGIYFSEAPGNLYKPQLEINYKI